MKNVKKRIYTMADVNPLSWTEFGAVLENLINKIETYRKEKGINFDVIVPVLRGGGIPATAIANRLLTRVLLPIQVKRIFKPGKIIHKQIITLPKILQKFSKKKPNFLVCETNTSSGQSAKKAFAIIRKGYPKAKIYYATVAKVYGGPNKFKDVEEYFWGVETNERFLASPAEEKQLNLRPKITIFPWELAKNELKEINNQ
jgi:hypoxanthine phosphoribosyltransferase